MLQSSPPRALCRIWIPDQGIHLGAVLEDAVVDVTQLDPQFGDSLMAILTTEDGFERFFAVAANGPRGWMFSELDCPVDKTTPHLLSPLDHQEVWAAGVTYTRSREARMQESEQSADVYARVYDAERPELFFKATAARVVGSHDLVAIRSDALWSVPEPELTLLVAPDLRIVACTIGNDMSSRDIEGQNPLYLPQAKVYDRCCALGPVIVPCSDLDLYALTIQCEIHRQGQPIFTGTTSTSQLHRRFEDLVAYLGRSLSFPTGVFLMTGTGIVPPDDVRLQSEDAITITIDGIGSLTNMVR